MNRVLGHFCDFFLEKWSKIGRFSGSERSCWDTFAIFFWRNGPRLGVSLVQNGVGGTLLRFFLEKWVKIEHFYGSERLWWDTFAIFCWCDKMLFLS